MPDDPAQVLTDEGELLFRQVNPAFIREGRVGSQAFRPTRKDERMLSVARSSLTTAQASFARHTGCLKLASVGTWAVTVAECASLGLPARPDAITEGPCPDPAHAVVDFTAFTNSKVEGHGARLARLANERGCLHPSTDAEGR
jgi:hypothetical protein